MYDIWEERKIENNYSYNDSDFIFGLKLKHSRLFVDKYPSISIKTFVKITVKVIVVASRVAQITRKKSALLSHRNIKTDKR